MKKCGLFFFLALGIVLTVAPVAHGAWINVGDGAQPRVLVLESSPQRITLECTLGGFEQTDIPIGDRAYGRITLPGEALHLEVGMPSLPLVARSVIISDSRAMRLKVVASEFVDLTGVDPVPSKGNLLRSIEPESIPYPFDPFYSTDKWFPQELAVARDPYVLRDYRGMCVAFNPIQYQPSTHTLRVYTRIRVELTDSGPGGANTVERQPGASARFTPEFTQIYQSHFLNFDEQPRFTVVPEIGSMLVICYDNFASAIQPFVDWKNRMGLPTTMVLQSEVGTTSTAFRNYIQAAYDSSSSPKLAFVLLVGDAAQIPTPFSDGGAADPTYAEVAGNDGYPDIVVGRFSAENTAQVETQVLRTIDYEETPLLAGSTWYPKGTGIGSQYGVGDDGEYDWEHIANLRTQLLGYGYNRIDRLYGTSATAAKLADSLNAGRSMVNYCGHGGPSGWSTTGFSNSNVNALHNENQLPFIFSVACLNGDFNHGTCFGETWLRATHNGNPTGAVGAYMSSINQYWDPPMEAQDEFVQLLATDAARTFGALCYNGSCQMIDQYGPDGEAMFDTWHIFGDPSLRIRTKAPEQLVVDAPLTIMPTDDTFLVNVVGETQALCGLSHHGQYIGSSFTNSNGQALILLGGSRAAGDTLDLTVTGYNRIPYFASILVVPPGTPNLVTSPDSLQVSIGADTQVVDTLLVLNQGDSGSVMLFTVSLAAGGDSAWAHVEPTSGMVIAGDTLRLAVTFSSGGLGQGQYLGELLINYSPRSRALVPLIMQVNTESAVKAAEGLPVSIQLEMAGPNPSSSTTALQFALPRTAQTRLAVFDAGGRSVRLLQDGVSSAGWHTVLWDGRDNGGRSLPAGVYFTRLTTPERSLTSRILRIR